MYTFRKVRTCPLAVGVFKALMALPVWAAEEVPIGQQPIRSSHEAPAGPDPESSPPSPFPLFKLELTASAWGTGMSGFIQTPCGGEPDSTSEKRPRFEEVGLDGFEVMPVVDARFWFYRRNELHLNYSRVDREGSGILETDLESMYGEFPAGSLVNSTFKLDMFRAGYRPGWLSLHFADWTLTPEIGFSSNFFRKKLTSPSVPVGMERAYSFFFPYLGAILVGRLTDKINFEVDVSGSGGITGVVFVDTDLRLVYRILERDPIKLSLVGGLHGTWLRRRDNQTVPNDLNLRLGSFATDPWAGVTLGLRLAFR